MLLPRNSTSTALPGARLSLECARPSRWLPSNGSTSTPGIRSIARAGSPRAPLPRCRRAGSRRARGARAPRAGSRVRAAAAAAELDDLERRRQPARRARRRWRSSSRRSARERPYSGSRVIASKSAEPSVVVEALERQAAADACSSPCRIASRELRLQQARRRERASSAVLDAAEGRVHVAGSAAGTSSGTSAGAATCRCAASLPSGRSGGRRRSRPSSPRRTGSGSKPGKGANGVDVHSQPLPTRSATPKALSPAGWAPTGTGIPEPEAEDAVRAPEAPRRPTDRSARRPRAFRRPRGGAAPRSAARARASARTRRPRRGSRTPATTRRAAPRRTSRGSASRPCAAPRRAGARGRAPAPRPVVVAPERALADSRRRRRSAGSRRS